MSVLEYLVISLLAFDVVISLLTLALLWRLYRFLCPMPEYGEVDGMHYYPKERRWF